MTTYQHPTTADVASTKSKAVGAWLESRGYTAVVTAEEAGELKGGALDAALDAAELPKSGTADEKRARLAEHVAAQLDQDDDVDLQADLDEQDELAPTDPAQDQ